jgi:hypothetical protein
MRHDRPVSGCGHAGIAQAHPQRYQLRFGLCLAGQADSAGVAAIQHFGQRARQRTIGVGGVGTMAVDFIIRGADIEGRQTFSDRVTQIPIAQARPDDRALCAGIDLPQSETPRMQSRRERRGRRTAGHVGRIKSRMGMQRARLQDVVLDRHLCRQSYAIRPSGWSTSRHDHRQRPIARKGRRYLQSKSLPDFRMKNRMRQNSVGR